MDNNDLKNAPVIEGEVQEENNSQSANLSGKPAELVVSLTNLINANLKEIESLEKQVLTQKEMVDNVLLNNETYQQHEEAAKEAGRVKQATKKEIFKRPDVNPIILKLSELKTNLKDTREELSNYIKDYANASGLDYFELEDGSLQEIVQTAKFRKKSI